MSKQYSQEGIADLNDVDGVDDGVAELDTDTGSVGEKTSANDVEEQARNHAIERGDFLDDGDDDGDDDGTDGQGGPVKLDGDQDGKDEGEVDSGAGGDGDDGRKAQDDLDAEALAAVAGIDEGSEEAAKQNGMPFSRANAIAREKNAALDLSNAILEGTVDKRWIEDMGGINVIAKGMVSGEIVLPGVQGAEANTDQQVHPEIAEIESRLDILNDQLVDATIDANREEIKKLNKEINILNQQMFRTENRIEQEAQAEQSRLSAVAKDSEIVDQVMVDLWQNHPALHSDTNEYIAFMARRDGHLRSGKLMSEALKLAASETFPHSGDAGSAGEEKKAERLSASRDKGARAAGAQPPPGKSGTGVRSNKVPQGVDTLSETEFDNMSEEDKAKARGDIL